MEETLTAWDTRVNAFVYDWFRKLDVHAPVEEMLPLLSSQDLERLRRGLGGGDLIRVPVPERGKEIPQHREHDCLVVNDQDSLRPGPLRRGVHAPRRPYLLLTACGGRGVCGFSGVLQTQQRWLM